eukprot:gene11672-42871_t
MSAAATRAATAPCEGGAAPTGVATAGEDKVPTTRDLTGQLEERLRGSGLRMDDLP